MGSPWPHSRFLLRIQLSYRPILKWTSNCVRHRFPSFNFEIHRQAFLAQFFRILFDWFSFLSDWSYARVSSIISTSVHLTPFFQFRLWSKLHSLNSAMLRTCYTHVYVLTSLFSMLRLNVLNVNSLVSLLKAAFSQELSYEFSFFAIQIKTTLDTQLRKWNNNGFFLFSTIDLWFIRYTYKRLAFSRTIRLNGFELFEYCFFF